MSKVLSQEEIRKYRQFLYEDEYKDGIVPEEILNPPAMNDKDIKEACKELKEFGFKYLTYCPNCHDSFFGASGLNLKEHKMDVCCTCGYDKTQVYDENANRLL